MLYDKGMLYHAIAEKYSYDEIGNMGSEFGYTNRTASDEITLARGLVEHCGRRIRLPELFKRVADRVDISEYLYELVAYSWTLERTRAMARSLGFDYTEDTYLGWEYDDFVKRSITKEIQEYAKDHDLWHRYIKFFGYLDDQ